MQTIAMTSGGVPVILEISNTGMVKYPVSSMFHPLIPNRLSAVPEISCLRQKSLETQAVVSI